MTVGEARARTTRATATLRVGFACNWDPVRQETWSGTPWRLREALAREVQLRDVGVDLSGVARTALKLAHVRPVGGGLKSHWKHARLTDQILKHKIEAKIVLEAVDGVLQVGDLAALSKPYFIYQDLSFSILERILDASGSLTHFPSLSKQRIRYRRRRQEVIYEQAQVIFTMSSWFRDELIRDGIDPARIMTIHPGINSHIGSASWSGLPEDDSQTPTSGRSRELLFIGRDFLTKGGDLVVAAHRQLRASFDPELLLTIAGPSTWPLSSPPHEGIRFLGPVDRSEVPRLFGQADLFVMPSRFEGFGIVFAEALASGTPCVARRAFAMPEIIEDGVTGRLMEGEDPEMLAEMIVECLQDKAMRARTWQLRQEAAERWSWQRAASEMAAAMESSLPT